MAVKDEEVKKYKAMAEEAKGNLEKAEKLEDQLAEERETVGKLR